MSKTHRNNQSWLNILLASLVICRSCDAASSLYDLFDLFSSEETIKETFLQSIYNLSLIEGNDTEKTAKHLMCLKDLSNVHDGIMKFEQWAMESK